LWQLKSTIARADHGVALEGVAAQIGLAVNFAASALCASDEWRRNSRACSCSASSRLSEISHPRPFFLSAGASAEEAPRG
jgi:hypothetical protein